MCGIIGISSHSKVVQELYDGLMVLQHRGQDAAGIATYENRFHLKKGNGLVRDVFGVKHMYRLKGTIGIGHVRYPTAGCADSAEEAQPFYVNSPYGIALIHNGNLTNYEELSEQVTKDNRRYLNTKSDSEVLVNVVADELNKIGGKELKPEDVFKAMKGVYGRLKGGYAVIAMIANRGLLAFRDPNGIRPLIFGKRETPLGDEYMFASESVALNTLDFKVIRDVQPGEVIYIDPKYELHSKQIVQPKWAPCIFEYVYLARPDSVIDGVNVYNSRIRMGRVLAQQIKQAMLKGLEIDVVVPVPDTGRSPAFEIAAEIRVPYREGLIKNRYIGRTFIMPGQEIRKRSIKYKLNTIPKELKGKKVLLVDDSIVRGNTSRKIVEIVREAGAEKVYFASAAPQLINPCVYGVDMPTRKEFIANKLNIEQITKAINADAVFYQTMKDLVDSVRAENPNLTGFCAACMDGKYPTPDITEKVLQRVEECHTSGSIDSDEEAEDQLALL
ncbi:amidophosphoribosyltransferase [Candidatus Peregrinibacteria bacterium CG11_big_fil_rev_8_21_14_0_20_46_8]|nr:MAG: amidophosphoribosyltransferase [Candidatus Peregrinibacteria bacterium CG11_big_fil_rev_8_21_14_0_20_46_8]